MPPPLKSCPVLPFRTARRPQPFPSRRNSLLSLRAAAPRLVTCSAGCRGRASRTAPSSTSCWASSSRPARQRLRRCAGGGGGGAPALARRPVTRAASRRALVAPWWRAASHEGTLGGMERCGGAMGTGWVREGRRCARAGRAAGRQGRGQEQPRRSRGSGARREARRRALVGRAVVCGRQRAVDARQRAGEGRSVARARPAKRAATEALRGDWVAAPRGEARRGAPRGRARRRCDRSDCVSLLCMRRGGAAQRRAWRQRRVDWERAGRQDSALADDGRGAGVGVGAASCVELIVEGGWYWKRGLKGGAGWGRVELVI